MIGMPSMMKTENLDAGELSLGRKVEKTAPAPSPQAEQAKATRQFEQGNQRFSGSGDYVPDGLQDIIKRRVIGRMSMIDALTKRDETGPLTFRGVPIKFDESMDVPPGPEMRWVKLPSAASQVQQEYEERVHATAARQARLARDGAFAFATKAVTQAEFREQYPKPDADGWIAWGGGERPVAAGALVQCRLSTGYMLMGAAGLWDWAPGGGIVGYRVVG